MRAWYLLAAVMVLGGAGVCQAGSRGYRPHHSVRRAWRPHHGHRHHYRHTTHFSFGFGFGAWFGPHHAFVVHRPTYAWPAYPVLSPYVVPYRTRVVYATQPTYQPVSGSIQVAVWPRSAAVYLDGVPVGIADDFDGWPGELEATPGQHTLTFVEPGYQSETLTISVVPGHSVRVNLRLARLPAGAPPSAPPPPPSAPLPRQPAPQDYGEQGGLTLDVRPMGAAVYVDGRFEGVAGAGPLVISGLEQGSHRVEVVKPGHQPFKGDVAIPPRGSAALTIRLDELY
jgi:hypothetical protein